jgi:hypothetical protein
MAIHEARSAGTHLSAETGSNTKGPASLPMSRPFFFTKLQTYDIDVGFSDVTCIRGDGCGAGGFVAGAGLF